MNANPPPHPYVMLGAIENDGNVRHHPYYRNVPRYNHKRSGRSYCFRCICCCCCLLFLIIIIIIIILAILGLYFYIVVQPKIPTYKVEALEVKAFNVSKDFTLTTDFQVTIKAENPNSHIGFMYGKNSSVIVTYSDSNICSGELPRFQQGHKNSTLINIDLQGKSEFESGLHEALQESVKNHRVPLLVRVKVPVTVVVAEIPLRQFEVFVNCSLVLDNLAPKKKIGIFSSDTTIDFKF